MIEVTLAVNQKVRVIAHPQNVQGQPAAIQGAIGCAVVSGDGTFSIDPMDPRSVMLIPGAATGDIEYKISGDSNLGGGITRITENVKLHVYSADATELNLVADPPIPK